MIEKIEKNGIPIIKASEELKDKAVYLMHKIAKDIQKSGYKGLIVIDISKVCHINSIAIGALVNMWKMVDINGNDLIVYKPQKNIRKILENANITRIIKVRDELDII